MITSRLVIAINPDQTRSQCRIARSSRGTRTNAARSVERGLADTTGIIVAACLAFAIGCGTPVVHETPEWCKATPFAAEHIEDARNCRDNEAARRYLNEARKRAFDTWVRPIGLGTDHCAVVQFTVAADGSLASTPNLVVGDSEKLNASAIAAVEQAAPFESVPSDAQCIVELPWITSVFQTHSDRPTVDESEKASDRPGGDNYLRYMAFKVRLGDQVLLRWQKRDMPLKIHLQTPPRGEFEDPVALMDVVRDGITDWTDVAGPGIPSFEFVDNPGNADIPIVWEAEPSGGWYIAHCAYDINSMQARFGVSRILLTGKRNRGVPATLEQVYLTMLHEVGHALGLRHSPRSTDIMYKGGIWSLERPELSARDRETLRLLYSRPVGSRVTGARNADR